MISSTWPLCCHKTGQWALKMDFFFSYMLTYLLWITLYHKLLAQIAATWFAEIWIKKKNWLVSFYSFPLTQLSTEILFLEQASQLVEITRLSLKAVLTFLIYDPKFLTSAKISSMLPTCMTSMYSHQILTHPPALNHLRSHKPFSLWNMYKSYLGGAMVLW